MLDAGMLGVSADLSPARVLMRNAVRRAEFLHHCVMFLHEVSYALLKI